EEPKRVTKALSDPAWVEAMQEELLQNKKDERGIVIKNKARLVTQEHTQEEGIDYDEVFAPIARIEAIRLFLAYASFIGFLVFEDPDYPDKVYKVVKTLYGLHQAPRAWYETLAMYLLDNRFHRGKIDQTLFIKKQKGDILLVQMSSMGELTFFLGLEVKQKDDEIFISQDKYVAKILRKFSFINVKTVSTPMDTDKPLLKDSNGDDVDVHLYRSMIGSLMYLTSSRPDIMFAVCACARFQVSPKDSHLHAVKRIFRLKSWQCKKQTVVATSTTEAEYVAAASCCGQVLWIQNQMLDYGYNFMHTMIHIDNNSTICIIKNPVAHSKTKHIEIRHHFIRDCNDKKLIQVVKIYTDNNFVDLLTKALDVRRFKYLVASIGMAKHIEYLMLKALPLKYGLRGGKIEANETVIKEWEDRMERAATNDFYLEDRHRRPEIRNGANVYARDGSVFHVLPDNHRETFRGYGEFNERYLSKFNFDHEQTTRVFQNTMQPRYTHSNDPPLSRVNTLGSGEDSMKLMELMELCTKLPERAHDSEKQK
ncbi:putative ribonuclease H-like domain-containing protein, partial [Tanacetum coccineum]